MKISFPWHDLIIWHTKNGRKNLPWRQYDIEQNLLNYRVWLSEVLLQQTQAERVIPYFEKILQKFPTITDLAQSNYDEFFPYYQGMGYYSRARNILKTAKIVSEEYSGEFPEEKNLLKKLPGIGEYTSSAILAFGYGKPFLAWDTNLEKVFSRFFLGTSQTKLSSEQKTEIENDFNAFVQKHSQNEQKNIIRTINNGLMDFARMVDMKNPANIDWTNYPIQCGKFYETRGSMEIVEEKQKEIFPIPDAKIVAILHENHKIYFSESPKEYIPFILPPSENRDTRNFVKEFFRKNYALEVSVRPIHKKWLTKASEPFVAINVQIQTGKENFAQFSKQEAKEVLEKIYEK